MKNEVDIDEAALAAEAAAIEVPAASAAPTAQGAPASAEAALPSTAAAEPTADQIEARAKEGAPALRYILDPVVDTVAPNWQVTDVEKGKLAHAAAVALVAWFPQDLPPKYAALLGLAFTVATIADAHRDEHGQVKPLRARQESPPPADPRGGGGFATAP